MNWVPLFREQEVNGELVTRRLPDKFLNTGGDAVALGGPFPHRPGPDGRCRVCGYRGVGEALQPGCPVGIDVRTLPAGKPLSTVPEARAALAGLRALWADDGVKEQSA